MRTVRRLVSVSEEFRHIAALQMGLMLGGRQKLSSFLPPGTIFLHPEFKSEPLGNGRSKAMEFASNRRKADDSSQESVQWVRRSI